MPQGPPPLYQVEQYLRDFQNKLQFFDCIIADRDKNSSKALLELGINGDSVRSCLFGLQATDYLQGPMPNQQAGSPDVWVFGHTCRGHKIYIKVHLGRFNRPVICISFHLAQYPLQYPLKPRPPQSLQP